MISRELTTMDVKTFLKACETRQSNDNLKLMQMMIFWIMMMVVMLQTWHDNWIRPLDINWLRYVSRHRDVLLLYYRHMPNFLHKHRNLLLDHNMLHFALVPVADVIGPRVVVQFVDLLLHPRTFLHHDRFCCDGIKSYRKKNNCSELRRGWTGWTVKHKMIY